MHPRHGQTEAGMQWERSRMDRILMTPSKTPGQEATDPRGRPLDISLIGFYAFLIDTEGYGMTIATVRGKHRE